MQIYELRISHAAFQDMAELRKFLDAIFHKIFKIIHFADRQHLADWGSSIMSLPMSRPCWIP